MKPITEEEYIWLVKEVVESVNDAVDALVKISQLPMPTETPSNISPLIAGLPEILKWNAENDYEYLPPAKFKVAQSEDAKEQLDWARGYINDYDSKNWYTYTYSLQAQYEGLYELNPNKADIAPEVVTDDFSEALKKATKLADELPDRFFVTDEEGPLRVGNYRLERIGVSGILQDAGGVEKGGNYHLVREVDWLEHPDRISGSVPSE